MDGARVLYYICQPKRRQPKLLSLYDYVCVSADYSWRRGDVGMEAYRLNMELDFQSLFGLHVT
jgi:hypothetical protein